jgi:hypothetical protein
MVRVVDWWRRHGEEGAVQLSQVFAALWHDARLQAALGLVAVDLVLGITAAFHANTFALSKLAGFVRDDLLGKLIPWAVLYAAAKLTRVTWADAAQNVVYAGVVAAWVGSIASSLKDLGFNVPLPQSLAGVFLTGEHTPPTTLTRQAANPSGAGAQATATGSSSSGKRSKTRTVAVVTLAAAAAVGLGFAGHYAGQPSTVNAAGVLDAEATHAQATGLSCGTERWDVKTLTDPAASQVDLNPRPATVADLVAAPLPANAAGPRTAGLEMETFQVTATLTGYKQEADSDYHLSSPTATGTR